MTRVVGGILFNSKGQVLIAQRKRGRSFEMWWEFPGGKIDPGETEEAALARELNEELGLVFKESDFTFFGESEVKDPDGHICLRAYRAICNQTIRSHPDHEQVLWVEPSELKNYRLLAADVPLAKQLLQ